VQDQRALTTDDMPLAATGQPTRLDALRGLILGRLDASYRLAAAILRDPIAAEDAVHDAVVTAWRSEGQLRDPTRFEPWFQRILVNTCRDLLRQRGRRLREIPMDHPEGMGAADTSGASAEREAMRRALALLSPDHQVALVLRYYLDLSVDDIADRTGTRPGTVRSRLHYALRELRAAYEASER
jgi:RNA polymerase sigma factor (sigma-70 family)